MCNARFRYFCIGYNSTEGVDQLGSVALHLVCAGFSLCRVPKCILSLYEETLDEALET